MGLTIRGFPVSHTNLLWFSGKKDKEEKEKIQNDNIKMINKS